MNSVTLWLSALRLAIVRAVGDISVAIMRMRGSCSSQASVIAIRVETPSYWAALGVWVCRESVKKALKNKSFKFESKEEMLTSAKFISDKKYKFDINDILGRSKLLKTVNTQKNITEFF